MCGIVGGFGHKNWDVDSFLSFICHRGPDSVGAYTDGELFLGHTRLSIQDLSQNGNQPMFSSDKRFVIVFNGEIYNHLDLRENLAEYEFRSTGDTETVLNLYIKYGVASLNMLNGIFALAIYDTVTNETFIARDQFGVKPLYIYRDTQSILFSSEMKTFLANPINKEIEPTSFANYITFLWSPGSVTPFTHVTKLLPGHYLRFTPENFRTAQPIKYYEFLFTGEYACLSEEELTDQLEEKLVAAVKRQMLSDVPVGFFLSGGLDSSLLVAIAKKLHPEMRFPCFTIDIDDDSKDTDSFRHDIYYANKVAKLLDVDLYTVKADLAIVDRFDAMIWHLDEPQADAAPMNVLNIAQLARDMGIKVLIGGTGGDDLFSGYRRHQALQYEKYFTAMPSWVRRVIKKMVRLLPVRNASFRQLNKLVSDIDKTTEERMKGYFRWLPLDVMKSLFSEAWQGKLKNYNPTDYLGKLSEELPAEKNLLNRMLYWELKTFLIDHNLNYTDKMSMAVGVEARVPFLDLELVAFSKTIPPHLKMKGKETKYLLKKVAERYLPDEIIYRTKTGFGAPIRKWITNDLDAMIQERLSPEKIRQRGIFDADKVCQLINDNKEGRIDASYSIWSLLAIESWMRQFADA